jgi:hypothetical protein
VKKVKSSNGGFRKGGLLLLLLLLLQLRAGPSGRSPAAIVDSNPAEGRDVCCVLSGRGLCDELITRSEKSYRLWRVAVCDQETSLTRRP